MRGFYLIVVLVLFILLTGAVRAAPATPNRLLDVDFDDLVEALLTEYDDIGTDGFILDRGTERSMPVALPNIDFDCDGEITVNDAVIVVAQIGATLPVDLWAYDLDRDGAITTYDVMIVVAEMGRVDLPTPIWCER